MIIKVSGFKIPTRYAQPLFGGILALMLMLANLLPASAAVVGVQPGLLKAMGEPASAISSTPSPDLLLVRRGSGGRGAFRHGGGGGRAFRHGGGGWKAYRHGGGGWKTYRHGGGGKRYYGGRRFYYSIPYYAYVPYYDYYGYYGYRPYYGRCEYWHRRCVANWGYANPDYYGCMRYQGCY